MSYPSPVPPGQLEYSDLAMAANPRQHGGGAGWGVFFGMPFVWFVPFLILTGVVGVITGMVFFPPVYVLIPLATFVLIHAAYRAVQETRRRNGRVIIGYVDTAVRLNLPLYAFLGAAESSERGRCARQIAQLRGLLYAGVPVGTALSELPDIPDETAGRIIAGEAMGQLRQSVMQTREFDRQADRERLENPDAGLFRLYPLFLIFASVTILLATMIFVIPKFKEIFKDFKTSLPAPTEFLMSISSWVAEDFGWVLILPPLVIAMTLACSTFMTRIFLPNFPQPPLHAIWQWLAWRLPFARDIQRNHGMAETCELAATAIQNGANLPDTLLRAEMLEINPSFKGQLAVFRAGLTSGEPAHEAARSAGLPHLLAGLLAMPSTSNESQAAMFGFLARHYRQRFSRTILFLRNSFVPILVLVMGFVVGFILLALFSPLVKLILSVANTSEGGTL